MKSFLKVLSAMLVCFLFVPVMAMAQEVTVLPGLDLPQYFGSLAAMVPLVTFLTSLFKKMVELKGFGAQLVSWIIAMAIAYLGWFLKMGLFADVLIWWHVAIYGLCVGLVANGFFKISVVLAILQALRLEPKKEK